MRLVPIILVLFAAVAAGEEEPTVLERLKSDVAAERAWGAHLAGKTGNLDAIPLLTELIRSVPKHDDKEGRLVVRAAFDALVQLRAPVSTKVLKPHLRGRFGTTALILLTRAPEPQPEILLSLFDIYGTEKLGTHGIAVGNLLYKEKAPGFAARLLRPVKMHLNVSIVDEGFGGRIGSRSLGARFGDGHLDVPEGFPPTAIYLLSDRPRPGSTLLADGPRPIHWYRILKTGRRIGFGSSSSVIEFPELSREWLSGLSGVPARQMRFIGTSSTSLVWTDAEAYVKHVTAKRNALLTAYWKLVSALVTKNALALDEARALVPKVTVKVHDDRKKPGEAEFPKLPAPPKRPRLPGEEPDPR